MLTEYYCYCDKDTAFALQKLGYYPYMFYDDGMPAIHLWHAQKWLRDEHQIHIMVDRFGQDYMWCIKEKGAIGITHQEYEDYVNYESALLGGIKFAIKLLKGE